MEKLASFFPQKLAKMTRIYTKNKEISQFLGSKKLKELLKKRPGSNRGF
jgi:hypothetical protein